MPRLTRIVWALVPALLPALAPAAPALARPVVVELFTSEGCSSCPPADAFLADLAHGRPDVLPLAYHITYWDSLGWRDPYALEAATARQRAYAPLLQSQVGQVYTPQMVIDGRTDAVGSDRAAVLDAIAAAARAAPDVPVTLTREGGRLAIRVGAAPGQSARLLLIGFDHRRTTAVARGENAGRTLTEVNVVRSITDLGAWRGTAELHSAVVPAGEAYAVLLQADDGRIIGAAASGASPAS